MNKSIRRKVIKYQNKMKCNKFVALKEVLKQEGSNGTK